MSGTACQILIIPFEGCTSAFPAGVFSVPPYTEHPLMATCWSSCNLLNFKIKLDDFDMEMSPSFCVKTRFF